MSKPTKEQIEKEIETLKQIKSNTSPKAEVDVSGVYPDTIHSLIDAQIQVLEQRWSWDDIHDKYTFEPDDCGCYVTYGVMSVMSEAAEWMDDIYPAPPSKAWITNEYRTVKEN